MSEAIPATTLYYFSSIKNGFIFLSSSDMYRFSTTWYDTMLQAFILCLNRFFILSVVWTYYASYKSDMSNSDIIKVNSIKICTKKSISLLKIAFWLLLVTNQWGTNFNVGKKASVTLLNIFWVLYLSRQYFSIKDLWKQFHHTFLESHFNQKQNQIENYKYQQI